MIFNSNKVVLKSQDTGLKYENVSYFIKKYDSDCCICLSYPKNSLITDCNHVFCKECLMEMIEFSKKCPICSTEFKNVFKVKLILLNEIRDTICFKKLVSCKNANYFDFPYLSVYYEESFEFTVNKLIYQAWDGQPYFLSENIVKKIKKENKEAPSLIFGMIRKITPKIIKKYKNLTCLSPHLHDDSVIYIVEIETS